MTNETHETEALKKKDEGGTIVQMTEEKEPAVERRIRLAKQTGLVCIVTMAYVSLGATIPWPSPALSSLAENNETLLGTEITLTSAEKDMTGSLTFLGTLLGAWIAGCTINRLGRRRFLQVVVVPYLAGWLTTALAPNTAVLLSGRFIVGLACGGTTIAGYAYVIELSDADVRGTMATIPTMGVVLGSLYTVALGYVLPWQYLSLACAVPPALFLLATSFLPESPSFLVVKGKRQRALGILGRLRGSHADVEGEVEELERRNAVGPKTGEGAWRRLLTGDSLRRMAVVFVLFFVSQSCGNVVMVSNTSRMLQAAGTTMDADAVTVIAGVLRIGGTMAAIVLLDVIGRRYCLVVSHAINASCLVVLGAYVYMAEGAEPGEDIYEKLSWVPAVCVTLSLFFCDMGVHPVPFVLSSEYFPTSIRAHASSVCISVGTTMTFVALQLYSIMQDAMTQAGLYWFYGASSVVGTVFSFVAVIEMKGQNVA